MLVDLAFYIAFFNPSHFTFHLPFFGMPGFETLLPSQPAHIMAMAASKPPLPGR